ncbi:MAG: helix-turn-helix domain-containing protein [Lachnospiraceae bacterium]|nr:helix-turn-helix domain-containing protein [Lachnospiraceae bacterium]
MNCGESIKEVRYKCLLSQKDFADAIGVAFSTVNRWENGKTVPNYRALKKISEYCRRQGISFNVGDTLLEEKF